MAAATVVRAALDPLLRSQLPIIAHLSAVPLAAWFGGLGAGVLTILLSLPVVDYLFINPRYSFAFATPEDGLALAVFAVIAFAMAWQANRWRRAEQALRAGERRMSGMINAATESIWLLDRRVIVMANTTAARRFGTTPEALQGKEWRTLLPPAVAKARAEHFEQVFDTGQPVRFEDERDGISFDHNVFPIFGADGTVTAVATFSRDVTEQKRIEEETRDNSMRLSYHVDYSPLAVIEWDANMRLVRWSGEAERLFGWRAAEVLGKTMFDFRWVHDDDLATVNGVASDLSSGQNPKRFSVNRNYRKDGSVVYCEWYNSALLDASGHMRSILSLVLDVTERTRLEEELRRQADQLAAANRLKDEFLATLSHELRTPLNTIAGWASILLKDDVSPDRMRRGMLAIARNARVQAHLVDDLLDVSRIVAGGMRLEMQKVRIESVVQHAVEAVQPAFDARHVALTVTVTPGMTLDADPVRLQQVVWNLLSNAVKFTPSGGSVSLVARRLDRAVEITVTDTGAGISAAFLPHIFNRFTQADSSMTRQHGGLGLGLAIVRHIVELHGGTVAANSAGEGQGATFTVTLPVRVPASNAEVVSQPETAAERATAQGHAASSDAVI